MKKNFIISSFILCCFVSSGLLAQQQADEMVLEHLQQEINSEKQNFQQGDLADKEYIKEILAEMYTIDQKVREKLIENFGPDLMSHPEALQLMSSMDDFHTIKMKEILQQYGWITISQFGEVSDNQAWLLVQHSGDLFFQEGCLFILSNLINQGETNKKNYAYLYDRVALQSPILRKQRYGTQFNLVNNEFVLFPYEGTTEVLNQRRADMGLNREEEYLENIKQAYHLEENH